MVFQFWSLVGIFHRLFVKYFKNLLYGKHNELIYSHFDIDIFFK